MADETGDSPKPKARTPRKPQRVRLVNDDRRNGQHGVVATPLEKDVDAWLEKGWRREDPTKTG